jgi:hypothetical protein
VFERVEFQPDAEEELIEMIEGSAFYDLRDPGLGSRLMAKAQQATEVLAEGPSLGRELIVVF